MTDAAKSPLSLTPCLWFNGRAGEAIEFYTALFRDSVVLESSPGPDGDVMLAKFRIAGQEVMILNGGPHYTLTPAFSFFVSVEGQAEVDRYWDALIEGGEPGQCGWLVDKFGVSWQIVPTALGQLLGSPERDKADRALQAMLGMTKLDVAALQAAYDG